jgi:chaperonin GroES
MSKQITPINGYVVLKPVEETEQTFGNIVIPDLGKERPEMGKVVATSATYNFHTDKEVDSLLNEGDLVLIPKLGSQRIVLDGEDYYICRETEILAIIE